MDRDTRDGVGAVAREMGDVLDRLAELAGPRECSVYLADAELDRAVRAADAWASRLRVLRAMHKAHMRRRRAVAGGTPSAFVDVAELIRRATGGVVEN